MCDRIVTNSPEDLITIEELARRLGFEPKTIRNKMGRNGIFKRGIHYAEAPGLPVMFRWSAVLALYDWTPGPATPNAEGIKTVETSIPMARGYAMK
jgi:hypothetical protein